MPYLTTITLRILSENPIPCGMSPAEVYDQSITGDYSCDYGWDSIAITDKACKSLLIEQGSDPGFFYPEMIEEENP